MTHSKAEMREFVSGVLRGIITTWTAGEYVDNPTRPIPQDVDIEAEHWRLCQAVASGDDIDPADFDQVYSPDASDGRLTFQDFISGVRRCVGSPDRLAEQPQTTASGV